MSKSISSVLLLAVLTLAACGGQVTQASLGFGGPPSHRFAPLEPGTTLVYRGISDGRLWQETVVVGDELRPLAGNLCRGVTEFVELDGEPAERTTEWLAVDARGDLWKFGEETEETGEDGWMRRSDSWLAGDGEVEPWVALPAEMRAGDVFLGKRPGTVETYLVASTGDVCVVPAGVFEGCVTLVENPDDPDDTDIILYAPGVGRVVERSASGYLELVEVRR